MKIRMTITHPGPNGPRVEGRVYDVKRSEGNSLVSRGLAVKVTSSKPKPKKKGK